MATYISSQEFQDSENDFRNRHPKQNFNRVKRKRITHLLVDKPLGYPFPNQEEPESLLSIGGA
jgi:hypothetical protein